MFKIQSSVNLRIFILVLLLSGFLIPIQMVVSLVSERQLRAAEAAEEVSSKWGSSQTVAGPFLAIPYKVHKEKVKGQNGEEVILGDDGEMFFLPEELNLETNLKTEKRKRGIYEVILYGGDLKMEGNFKQPLVSDFPENTKSILWNNARLIVSVSDPKGIGSDVDFHLGGKKKIFQPGSSSLILNSGLHSEIKLSESNTPLTFQIKIPIQGSNSIHFAPLGKRSKIQISSDWKDPSFEGNLLPKERKISETGFQAIWESSYFSRDYPQIFSSNEGVSFDTILSSCYGVRLIIRADQYLKLERSLKYAILFLGASFTLFFLLEIFGGKILHPFQYLMIGFAMMVFYILNLSLSEHVGFTFSYIAASFAVSCLIGYYAGAVLQNTKRGLVAGGYYLGLYAFLYVVLASEDNSLLLGSVAVFLFLALLMHLTRKIDWYSFGSKKETE
ncbi:cell envelope integrity protein CreD [Leptospira adleri]|uniref:Cell envelope integrity protein CreD n=1 Tax=Leptospira adleri TaxID=2023186 RepID=A0A2M9YUI3_9LEPT|nr:cell envelope integrity protein CreD [Leptospira adleri]PJZ55146.1 cell envelope integrity protein CreD [Leptospira adleri]PJZ59879.1 cell envelope integrity protein CreD [Leptospira adleri]